MSLNNNELKESLLSIFYSMNDGDDRYFAERISTEIANYAQGGSIATVDTGTISAGVFTGTGSGAITVDSSICEEIVYAACRSMYSMTSGGDEYFAEQLALGIHSMMIAGVVNTNVTGTVVTPVGVSSALTGTAIGTFTGDSATMESGFIATFHSMITMTSGGDEYMAKEMATTITTYLTSGIVSTQGQAALSGSIGTGAMS